MCAKYSVVRLSLHFGLRVPLLENEVRSDNAFPYIVDVFDDGLKVRSGII